jgi:hypothetical protein
MVKTGNMVMKSGVLYWLAAGLSLLGLVAHEALGAPMVLPLLLTTDLPDEVIWLHNFSWHVGTVAVAAMIALFVRAARRPGNLFVACVAISMSLGFSMLGIGLAVFGSDVMWETPAPYAWTVISIVGAAGLSLELRSDTLAEGSVSVNP